MTAQPGILEDCGALSRGGLWSRLFAYRPAVIARPYAQAQTVWRQRGVRVETRLRPVAEGRG